MFATDFCLDYRGVRPDLTITFPRFLEYMQETTLRQTQSTAYPMEWHQESQKAFFLTNWQVHVRHYPHWNDQVTIRTWPIHFKGILAERAFQVADRAGVIIVQANSKWCFTDMVKKRPVRPPQELADSYGPCAPPEIAPDYEIKRSSSYTKLGDNTVRATRRETDTNNHVNNVRYIEWALDFVPDDIYARYRVTAMKTAYRKQCEAGRTTLVETWLNQESGTAHGAEILSIIRDPDDPALVFTEIYTKWE